jgi:hypothetical protein
MIDHDTIFTKWVPYHMRADPIRTPHHCRRAGDVREGCCLGSIGDEVMGEHDTGYPHKIALNNKARANLETIATLLGLDGWLKALNFSESLALDYAKAHAKGWTHLHFCSPKEAALLEDNEEFFRALCEDGVIEWLTPFVLAGKNGEEVLQIKKLKDEITKLKSENASLKVMLAATKSEDAAIEACIRKLQQEVKG